jgi:hypothetical protein
MHCLLIFVRTVQAMARTAAAVQGAASKWKFKAKKRAQARADAEAENATGLEGSVEQPEHDAEEGEHSQEQEQEEYIEGMRTVLVRLTFQVTIACVWGGFIRHSQ